MLIEMANYLSACPELADRQVCVNYLAEKEDSVSLEISGSCENIREYTDGGIMQSVNFTLAIRDNFGLSLAENEELANICRKIDKWVEEQNLKGSLPILEDELRSVSVGVAECFKITRTKNFLARYEAKIELIYYRA